MATNYINVDRKTPFMDGHEFGNAVEFLSLLQRKGLAINGFSYKNVKSILKNNLDQQPLLFQHPEEAASPFHPNIRGKGYYQGKET